jgi:ferrous iron transport protein B
LTVDETWDLVDKITQKTVKIGAYEPTLKDTLSELTVKPWPGVLLAVGVLYGFWAIFGAWFSFFTEPYMSYLFNDHVLVWLQNVFPGGGATLQESSFLYAIFVGDPEATICFEAFGVLTSGFFVSIGIVLPAVLMFYLLLGIMEDCGYLPRLAVLLDTIFHKIGLPGFSIVPLLLSLGCNIPGVVACRNMETNKERFMAMTLMGVFIPCAAQLAVMMSVVPEYMGFILAFLVISLFIAGVILDKLIPGKSAELLLDVPPYRMPSRRNIGMKLWTRVESFLSVAVPFVWGAVIFVNLLYWFGVMDYVAMVFEPVFEGWFGVPKETTGPLVVAFLRKDLAVAHLGGIAMTMGQKVIAVTLTCIYFPCLATFAMVVKEGGILDFLKCMAVLLVSFFLFGGLMSGMVNLLGI